MPAITNDAVRSTSPAGSSDREPIEQRFEHRLDLDARERGAETEVRTEAQRDLVVRIATDVELVGVGAELLLVAVGRRVQQHQRIAGRDVDAANLRCRGSRCA